MLDVLVFVSCAGWQGVFGRAANRMNMHGYVAVKNTRQKGDSKSLRPASQYISYGSYRIAVTHEQNAGTAVLI